MIKNIRYIKKDRNKSQKGISMIALVITIIVIVILATIAIKSNDGAINEANIATYKHELKDVEVSVSQTRIKNQQGGIGEEYKETGFYPIAIENPPEDFVSFSDDDYYGYIVDLNYVKNKETKKGFDYKKYMFGSENKTITFGKNGRDNDVYIYDATGKVYYAKGFYVDGGVYYSDILSQDGPIISVTKVYNEETNVVEMVIGVTPVEANNEVVVRVNNSMGLDETDEYIYKYTAASNDTYIVTAEEGEVTSIKRVKVSEITEGEYSIVYHFQDGTTPDETVKKIGSTPVRLKAIKRDGYVHVGWAKTSATTSPEYAPGELFTENADTDLYAIWENGEAREFTITFNANGGENAPSAITKLERASITLPTEEPTYINHVFKGWSTSSTATTPEYLPGGTYTNEGNAVLFAVWEKGEIRVEFTVNPAEGGTAVGGGIKEAGSIVYITAVPNPGYSFYKWTVTSNNVKLDNNYGETTKFVMPKGTVKITVNFKKTDYDYTIKYNANNGFGAPNTQYKKHNESINISTTIPSRSAHQFEGWADKINSTTVKYLPGAEYTENASCTLYAVWKKNTDQCVLTFDSNGGTKAPSSITAVKGTIIRIPTEAPIRSNLLFLGWATTKDAQEPEYRKNDYYTMEESATLYAVWSDSEKPIVNITAEEKDNHLILNGNAIDNGGVISYAWTNEFYSESEQGSINWTSLNSPRTEITIPKDVLRSGIHCFYVKDESGNISYASIDVYKLTFYNETTLVDTKYKASGYAASLTEIEPKKVLYAFSKWQSETDGRLYEEGEKYLLEKDEKFIATWVEALAYIPSKDWYYATLQKAVDAVEIGTADYVTIQQIKNETTPGVKIPKGKKVSLSMETNILNCNQTAITVEKDASFKLLDGTITSNEYGIRNAGKIELLKGNITAPNGIYNSGTVTLGDPNEDFSMGSMVVTSTKAPYEMATGATLDFENGSFEKMITTLSIPYVFPKAGLTLRQGFELRDTFKFKTTKEITTLVEDLIMKKEVMAGSNAKPVEIKVTLECQNNNYTFQYKTDGNDWVNGKEITLIDNKTVYGRIVDSYGEANVEQVTVSEIVDLTVSFNGGGIVSNPASKTVKYKRTYGTTIPELTDTTEYYFKGWWTASSGGTQVTSASTVTIAEDHTLYAHWEGKPFTVTFNAGSGYTSTSSKTVYYGESYGNLPTPSRNSYDFDGWFTSSSGGSRVYSSTRVTKAYNHTLYAQWTLKYRYCECCGGNYYQCSCDTDICDTCGKCSVHCGGHESYRECECCGGNEYQCSCDSNICSTCGKCSVHCSGHGGSGSIPTQPPTSSDKVTPTPKPSVSPSSQPKTPATPPKENSPIPEQKCSRCGGTGKCTSCNGTGRGSSCPAKQNCTRCDGDGLLNHYCGECGGLGSICDECGKPSGTSYAGYDTCTDPTHTSTHTCTKYDSLTGEYCNGTGVWELNCNVCNGDGKVNCSTCNGRGYLYCNSCNGSGKCTSCNGTGK